MPPENTVRLYSISGIKLTFDQYQRRTVRQWQARHMTADRPNCVLSADVDLALILVEQIGMHAAAAFLSTRGAGFALTCRVLQEPARRRTAAMTPALEVPGAHSSPDALSIEISENAIRDANVRRF